ncbi:hypothetical protein [Nocardioides sp.]|uniref:hypothetical protein n=1 Tax=Nocardioides sp. TaxID=35761 RepID=UPI003568CAA0
MTNNAEKATARNLSRITGRAYTDALRLVRSEHGAWGASVETGLTLFDYVTVPEMLAWLRINAPKEIDCANNRHFVPTEGLGQCVACPAYFEAACTGDGEEYEREIDEDRFFERCADTEMYSNWAPPMSELGGATQQAYWLAYWRPTPDENDADAWHSPRDPWGTPGTN